MKIAGRLARLERVKAEHPEITQAELDQAAAQYETALRASDVPGGRTVQDALNGWRSIIDQAPAWAKRIHLNADPADLFL